MPLNRHLLLLVVGALVPLLIVGVVLAVLLVHEERQGTERGLQENARLLSEALDAELQRSFAALHALSRSESLRNDDIRAFYGEAEDIRSSLGVWDNLMLLSPNAEHLMNLKRPYGTPLPPVPQPEGTLQAAGTKLPYVSNVLQGRVETDWLMYIAYPVVHEGVVRYVVGATMSADHWSRWLAERAPADTGAGIVDRNFAILARSPDPGDVLGKPVQPWYREALESNPAAVVRGEGLTDRDVVVAFHPSQVSGWRVNLFTSGAALDAPMRRVAVFVTLAMIAALVAAVTLATTRARVVSRSIHSLQDALEGLRGSRRLTGLKSSVSEIQSAMRAAEETSDVLAERAEGLARAQEAARLGLWEWDLRTNQATWSAGIYKLLGTTPDKLRLSIEAWRDFVLPEDRDAVFEEFAAIADRGEPFSIEFRIRGVDGKVRWVASMGSVERDAGGAPVRMQGVNIDITQRRLAEAQLQQSEAKFRTIGNAMPALVWVADAEGRITFVNERWFEFTGQPVEQALGEGWVEVIHPDDRERLVSYWRHCRDTGEAYEGECRYRNRDGAHRWHVFRALPMRAPDGAIEQWIGCSVDVHDARQAREALREADRRKDEFLATLAHELRNPLAPIRNALEVIKLRNLPDPAVRTAQDMMDRQVSQMVRLIDDLLDVSRISRGRLELRREPVEVAKIVQQAIETSSAVLTQALSVSLPRDPVYVDGDPVRLAQVLSNLLNNAAKYTDPSGRVDLSATSDGATVTISVRDTGIGISPGQLASLFRMFSQVDSSLPRAQGGLGIGLALARSLVELHGGTIEARSEGADKGSEFIVRLPVLAGASRTTQQGGAAPEAFGGNSRRILVVDDVEDNVLSLVALLAFDGHVTVTARDGLEAVARAESFRPDVILLDLGLPRMTGLEACRRIRAQPWGRDMLIVALTGWGQDSDRERTTEAGFDTHFVKPVSYEELRRVLAEGVAT